MIPLSPASFLPNQNVLSSNVLGNKRVGNLRSPLFKIEHDQILIKAKASKIFMRVVIDNYHMGKHSGLLFGGTVIKEAESNQDFKWFTLSPKKFKGHWAYLEIVDKGQDAYIEIDQVRFANGGMGKTPQSDLSFVYNKTDLSGEHLAQLLDEFYENLPVKLRNANLSGEEVSFLNYLHRQGLIAFERTPFQPILAQAFEVDSKTPRERYVLAMGRGSAYRKCLCWG